MKRPPRFDLWLDKHHGVFTRKVALSLGVSERRFRTGTSRGEWVRFLGVWRLADRQTSFQAEVWATLLRAGPGARITGHTTLSALGMTLDRNRVVVVQPRPRNVSQLNGIVLRDKVAERETRVVQGMPSVSRSRAVVDALRVSPRAEAESILHESLRIGWISPVALDDACRFLACHRGLRQLRELAIYSHSGSRAESERRLSTMLDHEGLEGWTLNMEIRDDLGRLLGVGDAVFPRRKVVIEVDGRAWHTTKDRFQRDRTRQNALVNEGWTVLRFTWDDLQDRPQNVVDQIRRALLRSEWHVSSSA